MTQVDGIDTTNWLKHCLLQYSFLCYRQDNGFQDTERRQWRRGDWEMGAGNKVSPWLLQLIALREFPSHKTRRGNRDMSSWLPKLTKLGFWIQKQLKFIGLNTRKETQTGRESWRSRGLSLRYSEEISICLWGERIIWKDYDYRVLGGHDKNALKLWIIDRIT